MLLANAAPRYTRVAVAQTAVAIAGGESIIVHGILVSSANGGTVTVTDAAGATISVINVIGQNSFEQKTGFLADKGLKITTDANTTCTVFHTSGSA